MPLLARQRVEIHHPEDIGQARRAGKAAAAALGFGTAACEDIALAVVELASNLLRHGGGGALELIPAQADGCCGLQVEAADSGPGIADTAQAQADGFSTVGGLGVGLGAVNRLMDEFAIDSAPGQGTRIVCRKWLSRPPPAATPCPLDIGVATRPCRHCDCNGDAAVVKHAPGSALVGVIDGLGHGPFAYAAAETARRYLDSHGERPLDSLFRGVGVACRPTRGVVMALARFDWGAGLLSFASVGNIEARVFPASAAFRFMVRRGIIGLNAPAAVVTRHPWPASHLLVLHSDGLKMHWGWQDFPGLAALPAAAAAQELLHRLAKDDDDATVLVVKAGGA